MINPCSLDKYPAVLLPHFECFGLRLLWSGSTDAKSQILGMKIAPASDRSSSRARQLFSLVMADHRWPDASRP